MREGRGRCVRGGHRAGRRARPGAARRGAGVAAVAALVVAGLALDGRRAAAHVAASLDDNNRYLRFSLLGDQVRLVYTVFFGEVPGKAQRRAIDRDRDGVLSDVETAQFAAQLATEVAGQLTVTLDERPVSVTFARPSVGTRSASAQAGAFSVDLIATWCAPPAAEHQLGFRDRFALPRPGETEVQIDDGPGVTVIEAAVGALRASDGVVRFAGPAAALHEPGLRVRYQVAAATGALRDHGCAASSAPGPSGARWWRALAALAGAALLLVISALAWRRRRGRRRAGRADRAGESRAAD